MIDSRELERRQALLAAHYEAENARDIDGIMATFAEGAEMIYNGQHFTVADHIQWAHSYIGMSAQPGGLSNLRNVRDREHYTDDEVIVEGRLLATHTGEFQGSPLPVARWCCRSSASTASMPTGCSPRSAS